MSQGTPLFVTGTARSGTTLLCYMLNANPHVMTAVDPYLPLFRSFRNATIREFGDRNLKADFDPNSSFSDYYFDSDRIKTLDLIQSGVLNISFDQSEWVDFYQTSLSRIRIECADLAPYCEKLRGTTYREIFDSALKIIAEARKASKRSWVGFKEVWIIEFFAPLARAYPDAQFVVIQRDPRAVIASMSALTKRDPTQKAHILSFLRHWRKYAAFISYYQSHPLLMGRIHILKYEELVSDPEKSMQQLCAFLDIPFDVAMLDSRNYVDHATGNIWKGNSSFDKIMTGIETAPLKQWHDELDLLTLKTIELVCGPEMVLNAYAPDTSLETHFGNSEVLEYLIKEDKEISSWRSDFRDLQQDYGFELFRRSLLAVGGDVEIDLIRRSFLFEKVYRQLSKMETGI